MFSMGKDHACSSFQHLQSQTLKPFLNRMWLKQGSSPENMSLLLALDVCIKDAAWSLFSLNDRVYNSNFICYCIADARTGEQGLEDKDTKKE